MSPRKALMIGLPLLFAILVVYGLVERRQSFKDLQRVAAEQAIPSVEIIQIERGPPVRVLSLPGTVRAWYEAPIFGQVEGYVHSWNEDYGARVKAGQLLASIDTPGLDADFAGAKAKLRVAEANYRLALSTAARWQALANTPAVSKQEVEVQVSGAAARKAEMEAAQQEVARYAALETFKRVVAPFDGVVTARLVDVGSYVNAAGGEAGAHSSARALFTVADVHRLRVFVAVPQDYANGLRAGITAAIHLPSQPDRKIPAQFLTTARAFDANTRTAVTELLVDRADASLWPGTYVDVDFQLPSDPAIPTMPEQALIFRAAGPQVASVDAQNRIHLRSVTLGQNLGRTVQVTSGVTAGDRVVNNPSAGLAEGQLVRAVTPMAGYGQSGAADGRDARKPPSP